MARQMKSYRMKESTVELIDELCEEMGCNATECIEAALELMHSTKFHEALAKKRFEQGKQLDPYWAAIRLGNDSETANTVQAKIWHF